MIADSNGDRSGDTRPLWITGLSPPDSWRSLRQPGYLQLDQVRPPKHCVWGYDRTLKVRNFRSTKVGNFQSQLTTGGGGHNAGSVFRGERRSNATHESTTDTDAMLYRKGPGMEARLCYIGNGLMENRSGLIVDARLTRVSGHAERHWR